jgi:NitT/TauT family transport system substrate-binding protein
MAPPGLNPDGYLNLRSLSADVDWWYQHGYLKAPVDPAQFVDHSFVDAALARLGRYGAR